MDELRRVNAQQRLTGRKDTEKQMRDTADDLLEKSKELAGLAKEMLKQVPHLTRAGRKARVARQKARKEVARQEVDVPTDEDYDEEFEPMPKKGKTTRVRTLTLLTTHMVSAFIY